MDSLPEDEIEAIWSRNKAYIDLRNIKSISQTIIAEEIEQEMKATSSKVPTQKNPQAAANFLIDRGFHTEASKNQKILSEILGGRIRPVQIKGLTRFQIAKGTPSFITKEGKKAKAGQFISGADKETAIAKLKKKLDI